MLRASLLVALICGGLAGAFYANPMDVNSHLGLAGQDQKTAVAVAALFSGLGLFAAVFSKLPMRALEVFSVLLAVVLATAAAACYFVPDQVSANVGVPEKTVKDMLIPIGLTGYLFLIMAGLIVKEWIFPTKTYTPEGNA
jgi:hypothetical protein